MDYRYAYRRTQKELNELGMMVDFNYVPGSETDNFRELDIQSLINLYEKRYKKPLKKED